MPRQNFLSVPITPAIQTIFDDFVKAKDITKTAALTDMLELYMIATDENLYLDLKKKYLNVEEVKDMISAKKLQELDEEDLADTLIFIKLGRAEDKKGNQYNGDETIEIYMDDEVKRGYTWFSTESLYFGMSKKQVVFFKKLISQEQKVKILFAMGTGAGGENEIKYSADVLDIVSNSTPAKAPEPGAFPSIWTDKARIWIKMKNIKVEDEICADDLIIKSTGSVLKDVISNSQFHFGYVSKR